mmetsp:Transcript_71259/g.170199  ORF Transcript_71259/g.170199 Transcript_71259/m.170199 type:complete len:241 (-) Transcript_71259:403-1125(-)
MPSSSQASHAESPLWSPLGIHHSAENGVSAVDQLIPSRRTARCRTLVQFPLHLARSRLQHRQPRDPPKLPSRGRGEGTLQAPHRSSPKTRPLQPATAWGHSSSVPATSTAASSPLVSALPGPPVAPPPPPAQPSRRQLGCPRSAARSQGRAARSFGSLRGSEHGASLGGRRGRDLHEPRGRRGRRHRARRERWPRSRTSARAPWWECLPGSLFAQDLMEKAPGRHPPLLTIPPPGRSCSR